MKTIWTPAILILSIAATSASADYNNRQRSQGRSQIPQGQYQDQYDQGQYGQEQYDQGQYQDGQYDEGQYPRDPQGPGQVELPPDEGYDQIQQPPPRQDRRPPLRRGPPPQYAQPDYNRPDFRYRNHDMRMGQTLFCNQPGCELAAPPILPYPGPQVRWMQFPRPYIQNVSVCNVRFLPGGIAHVIQNGRVLLYEGPTPNVQFAMNHYRRQGICPGY